MSTPVTCNKPTVIVTNTLPPYYHNDISMLLPSSHHVTTMLPPRHHHVTSMHQVGSAGQGACRQPQGGEAGVRGLGLQALPRVISSHITFYLMGPGTN